MSYIHFLCFLLLLSAQIEAVTGTSFPSQSKLPPPAAPAASPAPAIPYKPLPKPTLPPMSKPFGMPGIVGLQNEKWAGTDYLGYLSHDITVTVEIVKTDYVPDIDVPALEARIAAIFAKEDLKPEAEVKEGPPLPFVQILLIIYPFEKGKFAVFGACRLFEQIEVMRKNFTPAGYWQGITWESQNVTLATEEKLKEQVADLVDGLADGFVKRYKLFNPDNKSIPIQKAP
jgi:hypothetical protein